MPTPVKGVKRNVMIEVPLFDGIALLCAWGNEMAHAAWYRRTEEFGAPPNLIRPETEVKAEARPDKAYHQLADALTQAIQLAIQHDPEAMKRAIQKMIRYSEKTQSQLVELAKEDYWTSSTPPICVGGGP